MNPTGLEKYADLGSRGLLGGGAARTPKPRAVAQGKLTERRSDIAALSYWLKNQVRSWGLRQPESKRSADIFLF